MTSREPRSPIDKPTQCEFHSVADDHAQDVAGFRAQGHANADFVRALRDGIAHHAINSDRGEQRGDDGEKRQKRHIQAALRERRCEIIVHRLHVRDRLIGVNAFHCVPNGGSKLRGIAARNARPGCMMPRRILRIRQIKLRDFRFGPSPIARVADNSHNRHGPLMRDRVPGTELGGKDQANLLADGIFVGPVTVRERFIDRARRLANPARPRMRNRGLL